MSYPLTIDILLFLLLWGILMKRNSLTLTIITCVAVTATAEERFKLGSEEVVSSEQSTLKNCGNYSLVLTKEQFPPKYEMMIPLEFKIDGFDGPDFMISSKVVFTSSDSKNREVASRISEGGKTYLPMSVRCKENAFVVNFWSGGNCDSCELLKEYNVKDHEISNERIVPHTYLSSEYE